MKNIKDFTQQLLNNLNRNVTLDDKWEKSLVSRALVFAMKAHENQNRKGNTEPYITHPIRVAINVAKVIHNDHAIAAALLHDTVEDTNATIEQLEKEFGYTVARIVEDLTEKDKSLPWMGRKILAIEHIKEMDDWSLIVKIADKIDNVTSLYLAYLDSGMKEMENFNAPLDEQIEMYRKFYKEIKKRFNDLEMWRNNSFLSELNDAIEDLKNVENRYKLLKR